MPYTRFKMIVVLKKLKRKEITIPKQQINLQILQHFWLYMDSWKQKIYMKEIYTL